MDFPNRSNKNFSIFIRSTEKLWILIAFILFCLASGSISEVSQSQPVSTDKYFSNLEKVRGPVRDNGNEEIGLLFGWPRRMIGQVSLWGRCPTVVDIDSNRDWEFSLLNTEGHLCVFQHDGAYFPGFPTVPHRGNRPATWVDSRHNSTSAAGVVSEDGQQEIVYITDIGYLHVIDENQDEHEPFPIDLGRGVKAGVPCLSDIDGNGDLEILFNTYPSHADSFESNAEIHVFNSIGQEIDGFPVEYPRGSTSSTVVGDITGDNSLDIIIGNSRYLDSPAQIWAWESNGSRIDGFPTGEFQTIRGAPTLADITGDGNLDIIFWAAESSGRSAGIFAYNGRGEIIENFPLECQIGHPEASPAIADITGDNSPEIVFGNFNLEGESLIYSWSSDGSLLEGFPIEIENTIVGTILIADVSGDGVGEIIATLNSPGNIPGEIVAFNFEGTMAEGFPLSLDNFEAMSFIGTPSIWDIDNDGDMDIIAITTNHNVLLWDTPGQVTDDVWLTYKGDMQRTGVRPVDNPGSVNLTDPLLMPCEVEISTFPNPFNKSTFLHFNLPTAGFFKVSLLDIQGRLIESLFSGERQPGVFDLQINAAELNLSSGLYFCKWLNNSEQGVVRLLYLP